MRPYNRYDAEGVEFLKVSLQVYSVIPFLKVIEFESNHASEPTISSMLV
jgi:hypothetical protein